MPYRKGKFATVIILTAFSAAVFFGLSIMSHEEGAMAAGCPFSPGNVAFCSGSLSSAMHHASYYNSFINVTFPALVFALAVSILVGLFFFNVVWKPALSFDRQDKLLFTRFKQKTIAWLSIFEASPNLA